MTGISAQERRRAVARALEEADGPVSAAALAERLAREASPAFAHASEVADVVRTVKELVNRA